MNDLISRQAAIDAFAPYAEYDSNRTNAEWVRRINIVLSALPSAQPEEEPKVKNRERLTNAEWVDLLSEQFNISRTSAKEMLHVMMSVKKEDNFKKLFSQG